jgi:hypothetical protein
MVVFYDHFPRGFALPASSFMRQFLDHFHLQPHHIGANAMMTLVAFATLCEAYLGIWLHVELFRWLIYFKTQTAETIPVICGTASFYARKTADFPSIKGEGVLQEMAALLLLCEEFEGGRRLCQFAALRRERPRAGQLECLSSSALVGHGEDSSADFHYADGGRPGTG